jgi:hypothetical protein
MEHTESPEEIRIRWKKILDDCYQANLLQVSPIGIIQLIDIGLLPQAPEC